MAEKNINDTVNEAVRKEVIKEAAPVQDAIPMLEHDSFEYQRNRDAEVEYHREENDVIYETPFFVQRMAGGSSGDRIYYNYAVGYKIKLNGKDVAQVVSFNPSEKHADIYDLLDGIYGESDVSKLYIVRTERTSTVRGVTRTTYSYSGQVKSVSEDGIEYPCTLIPNGAGNRMKFGNLITRLKGEGKID